MSIKISNQKSSVPFFVNDRWLEEFTLYHIEIDQRVFSYHYLPNLFDLKTLDLIDVLELIQENPFRNINMPHPSLDFFLESIKNYKSYESDLEVENALKKYWPKSQKLLTVKEFLQIHPNSLSEGDRYKLKVNFDGFSTWHNFITNHQSYLQQLIDKKIELVFDFNQTICDLEQLKFIFNHTLTSQWLPLLKYFEEPTLLKNYQYLSKIERSYTALDESLLANPDEQLLLDCGFFIIKPSLLEASQIQKLLLYKKPVSLSSCYEHPSIKVGYLSYLKQNLFNTIHGLSTFEYFS